jgi:hypothetical protein
MRPALVVGAIFNVVAAAFFLFPESLGSMVDLPRPGSFYYSWLIAVFIVIFAGLYIWLAQRPVIDRKMIVLAVVGKMGVFAVSVAALALGELSLKAFAPAAGDFLFVLIFLWWLAGVAISQPFRPSA